MKRCPFCAEEIQEHAIKCKHCGSWLASPDLPREESDAPAPETTTEDRPWAPSIPRPAHHPVAGGPRFLTPKERPDDPVIMGLLSGCCVAGLGQILVGQTTKGVALLVGNIVAAVATMGFSAIVTMPLIGIDAYLVARRLREGKPVGEWEFFPSAD